MLLSRQLNPGQNHHIKLAKRSFGNVAQFKDFGTTVTSRNLIEEEIERKLNSGNAYRHTDQNFLSPGLLSKALKLEDAKL
jgi:hypothetical protein